MGRIGAERIPELEGTDVMSAKRWFEELSDLGVFFHADDRWFEEPAGSIADSAGGEPIFTRDAAVKVNGTMDILHEAKASWPDPDFIYSLAGEGRFGLEADYPGFLMDRSIPDASRTGYVSVPNQEFPTVLVEDMSEFAVIQVVPGKGRLSEATAFKVIPTNGARFGSDGRIDASGIEILHSEARETASVDGLSDLVSEVVRSMSESRAPSR